jgi:hypothetical protein
MGLRTVRGIKREAAQGILELWVISRAVAGAPYKATALRGDTPVASGYPRDAGGTWQHASRVCL